ncbi:MAG: energy transducer TonB [Opitutaceae bacterium]|jgi:protein TonB
MNNSEANEGMHSPMTPDLEARILSWVSGEVSASESAELERLAATKPEVAAFKRRAEAVRELAQVAVSPDREPMRLSENRRAELLAAFNAVRRRNLAFAASFSVLLIVGIAWYGEITHFIPPIRWVAHLDPPTPFPVDPDPPAPVEENQAARAAKPEIAMPQLQDVPAKAAPTDFMVPVEPPHPVVDIPIDRIPAGGGGGHGDPMFSPSQLDEQPMVKFRARPFYPERMRQAGISGEVTVDFIVDPNGNVRNATAIHSSQREFEESACTAVSKWTFRPGRKGGHPVFVHMQVPIVFTLSQD